MQNDPHCMNPQGGPNLQEAVRMPTKLNIEMDQGLAHS